MGLEAASYISQLNANNPAGDVDHYATADDHLRLLKSVLQQQFPNLGAAAVTPTAAQINFLVGVTSGIQSQLDAKEATANKNQNSGYAGLNSSGQLDNARVSAANITQHQGSLALSTSQITSGTFADARIAQSNITQHQAAININGSQVTAGFVSTARLGINSPLVTNWLRGDASWAEIAAGDVTSGTFASARISQASVTQHQAALAVACSQLTGNMPDARIVASNVTQHQASITAIGASATCNSQTVGYRDLPRRTGSWDRGECRAESSGATLNTSDMATGRIFTFYNDSASSQTLTQGAGVTMRLAGSTLTGSRTVAPRGLASIWCNSATEAIVSGQVS